MSKKTYVLLDNWQHMLSDDLEWRFGGLVKNHPDFKDGQHVFTSFPVAFDKDNMIVVTSSGRIYNLGNCGGDIETEMAELDKQISLYKEWAV